MRDWSKTRPAESDDVGVLIVTKLSSLKARWLSKLDHHTADVVRGASAALLLRVLGAVLTFVLNLLIARLYGADGAGVYFLAFTVMTIATVFGRMGMDNALLRFAAARAEGGDWRQVKGVSRLGLGIATVASVIATGAMIFSAPLLAHGAFHDPHVSASLVWMSASVIPIALSTLLSQLLRARMRAAASMMVATVWTPGLAAAGLLITGGKGGPVTAVQLYGAAAWVTAVGAWWWWRRVTPELRSVSGQFNRQELLRSSVPLLWVAVLTTSLNWIPNFALGNTHTTAEVGIFNAASRVSLLVGFVLIAVDTISAPKFAALYELGDRAALAVTARNSARLMVFVALPLLLLCLLLPGQIMALFGTEFGQGARVLTVLALAQSVTVVAGSVGTLLMMSGHERQVRNSNAIAAAVCFVVAGLLVPSTGALGASIAVGTALLMRTIYEVAMVRRYLGIRVSALSGWGS